MHSITNAWHKNYKIKIINTYFAAFSKLYFTNHSHLQNIFDQMKWEDSIDGIFVILHFQVWLWEETSSL